MLITNRADLLPKINRICDAVRARKGISSAPIWPQATNIAGTSLHAGGNGKEAQDDALPPLISASNIVISHIRRPPLLVHGLLHRQTKMVLAGSAKTYKSWVLIDLGLSVASGVPWWCFRCQQGNVVYLNFELIQSFFEERVIHLCRSKNIAPPERFMVWNLRGKCYDLRRIAKILRARIEALKFEVAMIIVDPLYKAYGGLDENSASQMTGLMHEVEHLSDETGATIVFGAHFSKGSQVQKEFKDRISGSGVFGRDPDVIMTMTKHMSPGSYAVESELRYLPPLPDFVVSWNFPLFHMDESRDPRQLYVPGKLLKEDGPLSDEEVLSCLTVQGMNDEAWRSQVREKFGRSGPGYYVAKARLIELGRVSKRGFKYVPVEYRLAQ
jgi:hypothetical protein